MNINRIIADSAQYLQGAKRTIFRQDDQAVVGKFLNEKFQEDSNGTRALALSEHELVLLPKADFNTLISRKTQPETELILRVLVSEEKGSREAGLCTITVDNLLRYLSSVNERENRSGDSRTYASSISREPDEILKAYQDEQDKYSIVANIAAKRATTAEIKLESLNE